MLIIILATLGVPSFNPSNRYIILIPTNIIFPLLIMLSLAGLIIWLILLAFKLNFKEILIKYYS
jgi:hypothetical protein